MSVAPKTPGLPHPTRATRLAAVAETTLARAARWFRGPLPPAPPAAPPVDGGVAALADALLSSDREERILAAAGDFIARGLETKRVAVLALRGDRVEPVFGEAPGLDRAHPVVRYYFTAPEAAGPLQRSALDAPDQAALRAAMEAAAIETVIPLWAGGRLAALLICGRTGNEPPPAPERLKWTVQAAALTAERLQRRALEQRLDRVRTGTERLRQAVTALAAVTTKAALLDTAVDGIVRLLAPDSCSILLVSGGGHHLSVRAARGLEPRFLHTEQPIAKGIAGWVLRNGTPMLLEDLTKVHPFVDYTEHDKQISSSICVPLGVAGQPCGVVCVSSHDRGRLFDDDDLSLVTLLCRSVELLLARVS